MQAQSPPTLSSVTRCWPGGMGSSLKDDCGEKADLYAAAGIADYWVVNVAERSIEVRRDPAAGRFRSLQTYQGQQEVRRPALPEVAFHPAVLWEAV